MVRIVRRSILRSRPFNASLAYAPSASIGHSSRERSRIETRTGRSWTSAPYTTSPTVRPSVSVTMWRLRPSILFPGSKPPISTAFGGRHALAADDDCRPARRSAFRFPCCAGEMAADPAQPARVPPVAESALDRRIGHKLAGQRRPCAAARGETQDGSAPSRRSVVRSDRSALDREGTARAAARASRFSRH